MKIIGLLLSDINRRGGRRTSARGQAYVEFAMVLILIMTLLGGGVLVIRALFLEESLIDIASRAAQWGASTNSNDQIKQITDEAKQFADNVQVTLDPPDAAQRPIGSIFTVSINGNVALVGPGIAWNVPMSAQASALIEHNPMLFVTPPPPPKVVEVGDYVQVHTTAGDWLNLRRKPGLDGNTIAALPPGSFALVVDGPVQANGLQWWRIYAQRARIYGWCVDQADTVSTLIPIAHSF